MKNILTTAIVYNGISYPACIIGTEEDAILVGSDSLNDAIFDKEKGWYRDEEAFDINDEVEFFVPDHLIDSFGKLFDYIQQELLNECKVA